MAALIKAGAITTSRAEEMYRMKCEGKPGYNSPQEANNALNYRAKRGRGGRKGMSKSKQPLVAYRCRGCGQWHIGANNGMSAEQYRHFEQWAISKGHK